MTDFYVHHSTVTIGDTNLLQNMYFANYIKLSGVVRELWVRDHVPQALQALRTGLVLITRDVSCTFLRDFFLYDPVRTELWFEDFRNASIKLRFAFRHAETNRLHANCCQTIVFADADHRPIRMPSIFREAALRFTGRGSDGAN